MGREAADLSGHVIAWTANEACASVRVRGGCHLDATVAASVAVHLSEVAHLGWCLVLRLLGTRHSKSIARCDFSATRRRSIPAVDTWTYSAKILTVFSPDAAASPFLGRPSILSLRWVEPRDGPATIHNRESLVLLGYGG